MAKGQNKKKERKKEKPSLELHFRINKEYGQKFERREDDEISNKSTDPKTQIKGTNQKGFEDKNLDIHKIIDVPCSKSFEDDFKANNNYIDDSDKYNIDNNSYFNGKSQNIRDDYSFSSRTKKDFLAFHDDETIQNERFINNNSIENNTSSKIIGFKDIEKRLEKSKHKFKSNKKLEEIEDNIKKDMYRNRNKRVKHSGDNIHIKIQREIINVRLRGTLNLMLKKKEKKNFKILKLKKLSKGTMENCKKKKLKELMGKKLKDILTEDGNNTYNKSIIEKYLNDSPILELTLREYVSYIVYERENLNVDKDIKSKIIRADKILKKFIKKNPPDLDQEYYYKFLYHLFNFNWYIENIKGREKDYKKRDKSKEKKKQEKKVKIIYILIFSRFKK